MYAVVPPCSAIANKTVLEMKQYRNMLNTGRIKLPKANINVGKSMTKNGTRMPIKGAVSMGVTWRTSAKTKMKLMVMERTMRRVTSM